MVRGTEKPLGLPATTRPMELFKTAFDTTMVGVLALPWIFLVLCLLCPGRLRQGYALSTKKSELGKAVVGALLLASTYLLGAVMIPIAEEFGQSAWHAGPESFEEHALRARVYYHELGSLNDAPKLFPHVSAASTACAACESSTGDGARHCWSKQEHKSSQPTERIEARCWSEAQNLFHVQESKLLTEGRNERLTQLHQRRRVLSGATLDGFTFMVVSFFGCLAWYGQSYNAKQGDKRARWLCAVPGLLLLGAAGFAWKDVRAAEIGDLPIDEFVLALLATLGLVIVWKGVTTGSLKPLSRPEVGETPSSPHGAVVRYRNMFLTALAITFTLFASWVWTEVTYDKVVYRTFLLKPAAESPLAGKNAPDDDTSH